MIILEGNDASGKTSLAETLSHRYNFRMIPSRGVCKSMMEFRDRMVYEDPDTPQKTVLDRSSIISDFVYGSIASEPFSKESDLKKFFDKVDRGIFCVIYCAPTNPCFNLHKTEKESPSYLRWLEKNFERIQKSYDDLFSKQKVVRYDFQDLTSMPDTIKKIDSYVTKIFSDWIYSEKTIC